MTYSQGLEAVCSKCPLFNSTMSHCRAGDPVQLNGVALNNPQTPYDFRFCRHDITNALLLAAQIWFNSRKESVPLHTNRGRDVNGITFHPEGENPSNPWRCVFTGDGYGGLVGTALSKLWMKAHPGCVPSGAKGLDAQIFYVTNEIVHSNR